MGGQRSPAPSGTMALFLESGRLRKFRVETRGVTCRQDIQDVALRARRGHGDLK